MENYAKNYSTEIDEKTVVNKVMSNIFMLMTLALMVTGFVSYYIMSNEALMIKLLSDISIIYIICGAELLLVFVLSMFIKEISHSVAMIMFAVYSIFNGITIAPITYLYTEESVVSTFFITAATFGAMAIFGYTTKKNLSTIGRVLIMALFGLIIASIVNIFIGSSGLGAIINYVGVLIFIGLTAYDTQKIKELVKENITNNNGAIIPKIAIIGALTLYLDFINLFIKLLSIMGKRK